MASSNTVPPHLPLPVSGYTTQSADNVQMVNENKLLEELVLRQVDRHAGQAGFDQKFVAVARTHFQEGFMSLNRAVFKPTRLSPQGADYERMVAGAEDLVTVLLGGGSD